MATDQPGSQRGDSMTNRQGRTRPCTRADAKRRAQEATEFLAAVDVLADGDRQFTGDVVVSNAVLAAIAAADALCGVHLGVMSASENHADASTLLGKHDRKLGIDLGRVLALKSGAQYGTKSATVEEVKMSRRVAARLVDLAQQATRAAG